MKEITLKEAFEEFKGLGQSEKETVEVAGELARVIGELTDARISKGLTQRQLAEISGIKQSAIARMESLQTIPRLDTMIKLARCLDVKIHVREDIPVSVITISPITSMAETKNYRWFSNTSNVLRQSFTGKEHEIYEAIG